MDNKPTLKEYLKNNPGKGLNDYFLEWGQDPEPKHPEYHPPEEYKAPPPPPPPPPKPEPPKEPILEQYQQKQPFNQNRQAVQQDNTFVNTQPKSYLAPTKSGKAKISILSILGASLVIAAIFLPWISVEGIKGFKGITMVGGMEMPDTIEKLMGYAHSLIYHTIYAIPAGGVIALLGEISRNWVLRILGQVIAVAFGIFWIFTLYSSHVHITTGLKMEDLELFKYLQYGTFMMVGGISLFFIDMIKIMFGK